MKIIATPIKAKDLQPGDLFSTASQSYWNNAPNNYSIGERVYVRTMEPTPMEQVEDEIFLITIEK